MIIHIKQQYYDAFIYIKSQERCLVCINELLDLHDSEQTESLHLQGIAI